MLAGCGALRATKPEGLPGGDYRSRCDQPLHACLSSFESVCGDGYDVVRAAETREREGVLPDGPRVLHQRGGRPVPDAAALIGDARERGAAGAGLAPPSGAAAAAAPPPSTATAPDRPRGCFPGSTQACLGPGACAGAQVCAADGARFGACDCGPGAARDGGEGS